MNVLHKAPSAINNFINYFFIINAVIDYLINKVIIIIIIVVVVIITIAL
jgi:hypothetical protein